MGLKIKSQQSWWTSHQQLTLSHGKRVEKCTQLLSHTLARSAQLNEKSKSPSSIWWLMRQNVHRQEGKKLIMECIRRLCCGYRTCAHILLTCLIVLPYNIGSDVLSSAIRLLPAVHLSIKKIIFSHQTANSVSASNFLPLVDASVARHEHHNKDKQTHYSGAISFCRIDIVCDVCGSFLTHRFCLIIIIIQPARIPYCLSSQPIINEYYLFCNSSTSQLCWLFLLSFGMMRANVERVILTEIWSVKSQRHLCRRITLHTVLTHSYRVSTLITWDSAIHSRAWQPHRASSTSRRIQREIEISESRYVDCGIRMKSIITQFSGEEYFPSSLSLSLIKNIVNNI